MIKLAPLHFEMCRKLKLRLPTAEVRSNAIVGCDDVLCEPFADNEVDRRGARATDADECAAGCTIDVDRPRHVSLTSSSAFNGFRAHTVKKSKGPTTATTAAISSVKRGNALTTTAAMPVEKWFR